MKNIVFVIVLVAIGALLYVVLFKEPPAKARTQGAGAVGGLSESSRQVGRSVGKSLDSIGSPLQR